MVLFAWLDVPIKVDPFFIEVKRETTIGTWNDNKIIVVYKKIFAKLSLS